MIIVKLGNKLSYLTRIILDEALKIFDFELPIPQGQSVANRNQMKANAQDPITLQKEQKSRVVAAPPPVEGTPDSKLLPANTHVVSLMLLPDFNHNALKKLPELVLL